MANDVLILEFRGKTDKFQADAKAVTDSINRSDAAVKKFEKDATQAYNKAGGSAKGFSSGLQNVGKSFNGLGSSIQQAAGMIGVALSTQAVVEYGKESVKAFLDAEKNAQLLLFALKGNEAAQQRLMDQASRIQETTIFDDDSIQQAQTFLATQGRNEKQIQKVIDAAIELSTVTGEDLQTAVMQLDGTYEGNIGKLGKLDSAFKTLTKEQLANGAAVDLLIDKYQGTAKAMGDTTAGQVQKLKNRFGELQETVGGEIVGLLNELMDGLGQVSDGDFVNGFDNLFEVFDKLTTIIQFMPGPAAAMIRAFKEIRQAVDEFQNGDILGGMQNILEGLANVVSMGIYGMIKDSVSPGIKEMIDGLTDFEKKQLEVIAATDKQIEAKRKELELQGQNTAEFDKFVEATRQAALDETFEQLAQSLEITNKQFSQLVAITDRYGISARIASAQILSIKEATDDELNGAFQRFHDQLGVSKKDWDEYIGLVKEIPPVHEEVADSTKKMVGPYDALQGKLSAINKQMLDYITLGKDAMHLDRERFDLQNELNKIQEKYNELLGLHAPIAKETATVNDAIKNTQDAIALAAKNTVIPLRELNTEFTKTPKKYEEDLDDLMDKFSDVAGIAGALADLAQNLNTALGQIFGEAAQKNAVFAGFQKAITIATITFKSIEAVANGVAAFSAGVTSADPTKIIGGISAIIAGVGNLIGGLINEVNATQVPQPPSFYSGTEDTGPGGTVDSKGGFWAVLHPHEGVLNEQANKHFSSFIKDANDGKGMSYIVDNWITPSLKEQEKQLKREFAENIAASLVLQPGEAFDDYRLFREAKDTNSLLKENNKLLQKHLRKHNPWGLA